jgi:hypothetical protein
LAGIKPPSRREREGIKRLIINEIPKIIRKAQRTHGKKGQRIRIGGEVPHAGNLAEFKADGEMFVKRNVPTHTIHGTRAATMSGIASRSGDNAA